MKYSVILYYKYVKISDPIAFRDAQKEFCEKNDILGRIYVSEEGINGTASGTEENINKYKDMMFADERFSDIVFKEDPAEEHAFKKLIVRYKKEIVNSGHRENLDPFAGAKRLTPDELHKLYENNEDFVIIDARNDYESKIGKFKNAIAPEIKNFRQWDISKDILADYKNTDKKIVMYCTGGIRCEKASAFLVNEGFENLYQLEGGIVSYTKKYPDAFWEGSVFVFDNRRIVTPNNDPEIKHIAECEFCGEKTSYYINCHNMHCDKIMVCCHKCKYEQDYCCSDECRSSDHKRKAYEG